MALPTFARFGNVTGDQSYWNKMFALYAFTAYSDPGSGPGLWSPQNNLFFRDATYFNKSSPNGKPIFWARGNGWAIAAMARASAQLPPTHPFRVEFVGKLTAMAHALAAVQGADGLWRSSLLDADAFPNPEATGTGLMTHALAWAVNEGVLPRDPFEGVVAAAWAGLANIALQPSGLVGWCQPPNGQPAPATQNSTSDFCVGAFLMAGAETARLFA